MPEPEIDDETETDADEQWSDEQLRRFIVGHMANAEIEGYVLVDNMETVFKWIKHGTVMRRPRKVRPTSPPIPLRPQSE